MIMWLSAHMHKKKQNLNLTTQNLLRNTTLKLNSLLLWPWKRPRSLKRQEQVSQQCLTPQSVLQKNPLMSTLATAQNGCLPHAIHNFMNIGNKDGKYVVWLEGMLQKCHPSPANTNNTAKIRYLCCIMSASSVQRNTSLKTKGFTAHQMKFCCPSMEAVSRQLLSKHRVQPEELAQLYLTRQ